MLLQGSSLAISFLVALPEQLGYLTGEGVKEGQCSEPPHKSEAPVLNSAKLTSQRHGIDAPAGILRDLCFGLLMICRHLIVSYSALDTREEYVSPQRVPDQWR